MKRILPIVLLCTALTGCVIGMPRYRAGGVESIVRLPGHFMNGELIAALPDHLIILDHSRSLFRVYYTSIQSATFKGAGVLVRNKSAPTDSAKLLLLRSLSAYPQGISDSLLEVFRKARSGSELTIIRQ